MDTRKWSRFKVGGSRGGLDVRGIYVLIHIPDVEDKPTEDRIFLFELFSLQSSFATALLSLFFSSSLRNLIIKAIHGRGGDSIYI